MHGSEAVLGDSHISDREAVAGILLSLVLAKLLESGANKTSRTGLHLSVPVGERPSVRRGLTALVDHGVLAMSGEDIGFTFKGRLLLVRLQRARSHSRQENDRGNHVAAQIDSIVNAIDRDDRFDPQGPIGEMQSLPARLQAARKPRRSIISARWVVLGCLLAVAAASAFGH